jgi:hypothetical protein
MKPLASYEAALSSPSYWDGEEQWRAFTQDEHLWREPEPAHAVRILQYVPRAPRTLPESLLREIERSREMLTWGDDWDEEGSPRFEEATWRKAIDLLKRHAALLSERGIVLPTPRILPGPNGSIDLHWETDGRELLINVPPDGALAGFYGEAAGKNSIKGKLDLESSDLGLFTWLTTID